MVFWGILEGLGFFEISLPPEDIEESGQEEEDEEDTSNGATDDSGGCHGLSACSDDSGGFWGEPCTPWIPHPNILPPPWSSPSGRVSNSCWGL